MLRLDLTHVGFLKENKFKISCATKDNPYKNLTETVISYQEFLPKYFPLVHPSPLNFRWHGNNKWFLESITPELKKMVATILMETEEQNSMC